MCKNVMSSRDRMINALNLIEPDHPPCSFMLYGALKSKCHDYQEFIEKQVSMGLDTFVELPVRPPVVVNDHYNLHGLPVSYDYRVKIKEWVELIDSETWPILVKEYDTPAGTLRTEVRKTDDWRWGKHIPFLDDYLIPRSRKFLINSHEDLNALQFLLTPPSPNEIAALQLESNAAVQQAKHHRLLIAGGWGVGADMIGWLCGLENMIYMLYDSPGFIKDILDMISTWNRKRMQVVLDLGVDLYIKRAWYENLDFFTPTTWREYLLPILNADADLAHEMGAKFGYIITSNCMHLLDLIVEAGVDVLIGVDPHLWDLETTKNKLEGKLCLWGGVNGHLTIEQGSAQDVKREVQRAINILAPGGGFILSPVDNVREDTRKSRRNIKTLISEWRRCTGI